MRVRFVTILFLLLEVLSYECSGRIRFKCKRGKCPKSDVKMIKEKINARRRGRSRSSSFGYIQSENYPKNYPVEHLKQYTITVDKDERIELKFEAFELEVTHSAKLSNNFL